MDNIYLVLGGNGFIGKHVISELCSRGRRVINVDLQNSDCNINLELADLEQIFPFLPARVSDIAIINCAGYNQKIEDKRDRPVSDWYNLETWSNCLNLNLTLPFRIAKFAEKLGGIVDGKVDVVFLGSMYSTVKPNSSLYTNVAGVSFKEIEYVTSKHGLIGLTKAISAVIRDDKVRFNVISPGAVYHENMAPEFLSNLEYVAGGVTNDVNELAKFVAEFMFENWTLFRGENIKAYGGAFN